MRLKKVIKNAVRGKSVVKKFANDDLTHCLEEVVYAMPPLQAMTYYYYQFILKDFAWEKYPRYIEGVLRSAKVANVWYYDKIKDIVIRSSPYTGEDKWQFRGQVKKAVLPPKRQVKKQKLKPVKEECSDDKTNTIREICGGGRKPVEAEIGRAAEPKRLRVAEQVERLKEQDDGVRKVVPFRPVKRKTARIIGFSDREQEVKVLAENSVRQVRHGRLRVNKEVKK